MSCLGIFAEAPVRHPQVIEIRRVGRGDPNGLGDESDRMVVPVGLMGDEAQKMEGVRVVRLSAQHLLINSFRLGQPARLVMRDGFLERGLGGAALLRPLVGRPPFSAAAPSCSPRVTSQSSYASPIFPSMTGAPLARTRRPPAGGAVRQ